MTQQRIESAILRALSDRTALHVMDLAERIEEHPVAVDQTCAQLHDEGYIAPSNRGIYDITTRGQRRLNDMDGANRRKEPPDEK